MKAMQTDRMKDHVRYAYFSRRMEPPMHMRRFSVRPRDVEPDAQPGDKALGWFATLAIAGWLIWCALVHFKVIA